MMLQRLLLVYILVQVILADNDREYCGLTFTSGDLASTQGVQLQAIHIKGGHRHQPSELLSFNSATGAVTVYIGEQSGAFPRTTFPITPSTFCTTGKIHVMDLNADSFDDMICEIAGVITFRLFNYDNFSPVEALPVPVEGLPAGELTFACDTSGGNNKILIGDFDGNGSEDIFCLDITTATIGTGSKIFFSSECLTGLHYHVHGGRFGRHVAYYPHYGNLNSKFQYHYHHSLQNGHHSHVCHHDLPLYFSFQSDFITDCNPSTDEVIVADVNGDHRHDLVCHKQTGDGVAYYLSSGMSYGAPFRSSATPAGVTCTFADNKVIAADVDGDGDDDLVCVHRQNDDTAIYEVAHFSNGAYKAFETLGTPCSLDVCTDAAAAVDIAYTVGDFNNDGYDDYMCRWDDATVMQTRIYYSVPVPA